jgi:hypothetical protein
MFHSRNKRSWLIASLTLTLVAAMAIISFVNAGPIRAQTATPTDDGIGRLQYMAQPSGVPNVAALRDMRNTTPHWTSSFAYKGTTYPFTMVGSDPAVGSITTRIPTVIIPMSFTFSNGVTLDASQKVAPTLASPIYTSAEFTSGQTQYGDAIQRAEFWNDVSTVSPGYHVLLKNMRVLPTASFHVPASQGEEITGKQSHAQIGLINERWFEQRLLQVFSTLNISGQVTPIFLTNDTFLYIKTPKNCCIGGFHTAFNGRNLHRVPQFYTFIFSAYLAPGVFGPGSDDVTALSHEVAEWMNDPFVNNTVPAWSVPSEPQYGCSDLLETGDPLVGVNFTVNGYHLQDEAFLPWFARESPSPSIHGQYTYLGTFPTFSPSC